MRKVFSFCLILGAILRLAAQNTDSLEKELTKNPADTIRLKLLTELSWAYSTTDISKSQRYAEEELGVAQKINNRTYIAQAYNDLGIVAQKRSDFKMALALHKKALGMRLMLKNEMDIASSYFKMSTCSHELTDYASSCNYALKSLEIYERLNNKLYIAYTLNTVCAIMEKLQQHEKLMQYAQRSYSIAIAAGDKSGEGTALNYMAVAFYGEKKIDEALKTQKHAYDIFAEIPDSNYMAAALCNMGYYSRLLYKDREAVGYYGKALSIAERINDINSVAMYCQNLAGTYSDMKLFNEAAAYIERAEKLAREQSMNDVLTQVYRIKAELCIRAGKQDEAITYLQKFEQLKDSVFSKETAKQFSEMQVKYETEKKESENNLLQKENELKTAQLSRGRVIQLSLAGAILMSILVMYLLYVRSRLKQKQLLAAETLRQQELRSKAVIKAEEKERTRIARELHDGIGQQLSAAKMNISGLRGAIKITQPEEELMLQNALDLLDESVKEVRSVSHSMMPNALVKSGLVSAVREFINKISSSGNLKINLEIIGLKDRMEAQVENILFRILQEVVNNIIKHAGASEVGIQFIKHEKELTILVEDNGVGFDVGKQLSETQTGIGLRNIASRVAFLNGEVIFDSFPGKGTTVTIEIPL